jgi:hypothetical protein
MALAARLALILAERPVMDARVVMVMVMSMVLVRKRTRRRERDHRTTRYDAHQ